MNELTISIKNSYVKLNINHRRIEYLVSPALIAYKKIKKFNKKTGVITLMANYLLPDKQVIEDEDWIDLKEELGFAFSNPEPIIASISSIRIIGG